MKLTTILIPEKLLEELDELVEKRYYPSRAEAIRIAISNLIHEHREWNKGASG